MKYYKVGKIVNTHGIRGEMRVIPTTDFVEERFAPNAKLYIEMPEENQEVTVESARPHKGMIIVKFVGFDNINDVEKFRNHQLLVSEEDQEPLEDGAYYYHQIIGLKVKTVDGRDLGTIKEILSPGANDVWVVQRPNQNDLLLPKIDDVVKDVNLEDGVVTVELMEGLE
ncbi:ribosome maturation factor RimM [Lactobacillaceae bacterium 24-114]